jgi:tyrosyl-tRNA synthetase
MTNVVQTLEERGLLEALTSPDIRELVGSPTVVYAGFDPTSDSLQVGNLVAIIGLCHFQRAGHRVIALAGGATGLIGDPSGKAAERDLPTVEAIEANVVGIRENLSRFLDFNHPTVPASIVNNADWMAGYGYLQFLRDVGKHFRMGTMIGKDHVRTRLEGESGMSYAEFSYQILQAYDFLHLLDKEGCRVQLGGSDQWGNITAGIDLIHKLRGESAHGITIPLVCDSAGQKFGKSEGNAVYLDSQKTSCYDFYQFFLRTEDADAERFLKIFTFLELPEIDALVKAAERDPQKRITQTRLAEEVTRMVHGDDAVRIAQRASDVLFGGEITNISADDLLAIFVDVPSIELPLDAIAGKGVVDIAVGSGLMKSKGEARRLIANGGLYINNQRVSSADATVADSDLVDRRILVLRSGKRSYRLVKVV